MVGIFESSNNVFDSTDRLEGDWSSAIRTGGADLNRVRAEEEPENVNMRWWSEYYSHFVDATSSNAVSSGSQKKLTGGTTLLMREYGVLPVSNELVDSSTAKAADTNFNLVMRAHYAKTIVDSLKGLARNARTPSAAGYADRVLRTIRRFRDSAPSDKSLRVFMALHDALAFDNRWATITSEQFEKLTNSVTGFINNRSVTERRIRGAIASMESAGVNTTPFGAEMEFEDFEE